MALEVCHDVVKDNVPRVGQLNVEKQTFGPIREAGSSFRMERSSNRNIDLPGAEKRIRMSESAMQFGTAEDNFCWLGFIERVLDDTTFNCRLSNVLIAKFLFAM